MQKIVRMTCLIHENSLSKLQVKRIERETKRLYQNQFGKRIHLIPVWMMIPKGQAFIAGRPSTASTVSISVADGTENDRRHAFMSNFCEMWMETTACSENEIILSVMDAGLASEYIDKSLERIAPNKRKRQGAKLLKSMLHSKVSKGYLSTSINMN